MVKEVPEFRAPPVTELALSVQFAPRPEVDLAFQLDFWSAVKDRFPRVEQQPPLGPLPIEDPSQPPPLPQVSLVLQPASTALRLWVLNASGTELIQLQSDRFAYNWRKQETEEPYPRYATVRARFEAELRRLNEMCVKRTDSALAFNQCEVTYIDHLFPSGPWKRPEDIHEVFSAWRGIGDSVKGLKVEDLSIQSRIRIDDGAGKPVGRIQLVSHPAIRISDQKPLQVLQMTGRGAPMDGVGPVESVMAFLDLAHERVVSCFTEITTPQMRAHWSLGSG